jgi:hypothetical protein
MSDSDANSFSMDDRDWENLLRRIKNGRCTPFLGAGAAYGTLPLGGAIAKKWREENHYPEQDEDNLARIAQYLAIDYGDSVVPKEKLVEEWFSSGVRPNYSDNNQPHGVLASLPLPIYITTNYDNFMMEALQNRLRKPRLELCRWNSSIYDYSSVFDDPNFAVDRDHPIVFHLHGHKDTVNSLVLTEDDYIDFLLQLSKDREHLLPAPIQSALASTSLLFIGYSLADLNFRVIYRGIFSSVQRSQKQISFTIQFPRPEHAHTQDYLEKYFNQENIKVIWGDAKEFASELDRRWKEFNRGNGNPV